MVLLQAILKWNVDSTRQWMETRPPTPQSLTEKAVKREVPNRMIQNTTHLLYESFNSLIALVMVIFLKAGE